MAAPDDRPPPLGPVLRHYGPWLLALVALGVAIAAWRRADGVEARIDALAGSGSGAGSGTGAGSGSGMGSGAGAGSGAGSGSGGDAGAAVIRTTGLAPAWECSGGIASELALASVGRHGPAVIDCFGTVPSPPSEGTLVVRMRVDATGHVDAVHIAGVEHDALVECVGRAALAFRFPPPVGGSCAVVEAPFVVP